jgi:hypothetical protein
MHDQPLFFRLPNLTSKLNPVIRLLVLAVPFLVLVVLVGYWGENIVFHDDYALLAFLLDWIDPAIDWSYKLQRLVEPHNHHRIIYDRLVTLGTYYLTGRINILVMIMLGNVALLGIVWRLWRLFRQSQLPVWYFIPIPWWMLNLQSHENMLWGMAALQNFTVIWFMFEALHRLVRRDRIMGPLLFSIAALFTSGNGLLVVVVGSLIVGWQWRRRSDGWVWVVGCGMALLLFFWHYDPAPATGTLLMVVPKFVMVLGAALTNQARLVLAALGGMVVLLACTSALVILYRNRSRQRLSLVDQTDFLVEWLALGAVVVGTALILGVSRPPDELLRDRYRIYSHLSFSLTYLLCLLLINRRFQPLFALLTGLTAVAMYGMSAYAKIPEIIVLRQKRQLDAFNVRYHGTTLPPPYYAEGNRKELKRAFSQAVLRYPAVWSDPATWPTLPFTCQMRVEPFSDPNPIVFFAKNNHYLRVYSTPAFIPAQSQLSGSTCLIAESARGVRYALPSAPLLAGKRDLLTQGQYFRNERITEFQKAILPPGTYRLGLLYTHNNTVAGYAMSGQRFVVAPTD